MLKIHEINERYSDAITKYGLLDEETVFNWSQGQQVTNRTNSSIHRVFLDDIGYVYIKKYSREKFGSFIKGSTSKRELNSSRLMQKAGLGQPEVICVATRFSGLISTGSFIITKEVENSEPLDAIIKRLDGSGDSDGLKRIALYLRDAMNKMHENGFCHWDFKPRNILVISGSDGFEFVPIDSRNGRTIRPWDRLHCIKRDLKFLIKEKLLAPYFCED